MDRTRYLLPKHLPANTVIVIDNASFHKGKDMKQLIINAGHLLEYIFRLIHRDLNPIEQKWAKAIRRRHDGTISELLQLEYL